VDLGKHPFTYLYPGIGVSHMQARTIFKDGIIPTFTVTWLYWINAFGWMGFNEIYWFDHPWDHKVNRDNDHIYD
jgi:hypothetical protein